ncbi:replication protein A 70 kDa DNA-binding subunit B-like [Apium graveolens]|uniref:replication protein A 70 kDa DNA-binding subunit B-like n=1 Tax=Apium graveolens TaxID=4045 RepID=UPI003D7A1955
MQGSRFSRIAYLTTDKTSWRIKVRLTRMWPGFNGTMGDFKGLNLTFLDDDKTHIHAYAGPEFCNGQDSEPTEGHLYSVSNLTVTEFRLNHSPVSNKKCIFFQKYTKIERITKKDEMIPHHKFELVSLGCLHTRVGESGILIDVIAVFEGPGTTSSRHTQKGIKNIFVFDIVNGSLRARVTVWDKLADKLRADVESLQGMMQISSYGSSKYYIDLDYEAAHDLRRKFSLAHDAIDESEFIGMEVMCFSKIEKIDDSVKWWYYGCDICSAELEVVDDFYRCTAECKQIVSYPDKRFHVTSYVSDSTGIIHVIFFDREIRRLTSKNVNNIQTVKYNDGSSNEYPKLLKELERKQLPVTICLNKNNLLDNHSIFFASDVAKCGEAANAHCPVKINAENILDLSYMDGCGSTKYELTEKEKTSLTNSNPTKMTPDSVKSTNKRFRPSASHVVLDDDVVFDVKGHSEKIHKVKRTQMGKEDLLE